MRHWEGTELAGVVGRQGGFPEVELLREDRGCSAMAKFVCTDDEVMVDKVIGEKKTVGERLPSYGRDLVPYFVPGAARMDEGSINVNTDIDALRR